MKKRLNTFAGFILAAILLLMCGINALAEEDLNLDFDSGTEMPENGIPLVVIRVDERDLYQTDKGNWYGTIADMNASPDHSVRCKGSLEILVPDGFHSEYGGTVPQGSIELDYIRGRGNSTWKAHEKKPYRIQMKEGLDIFGMGESKEWALLANAVDRTMIKNRLTYWLGSNLGLSYSPQMVPVDVVMIGSRIGRVNLGSYYICETVSFEPSRIAIEKPGKNVISEEGDPNITGGYLLSVYNPIQDYEEPEGSVFSLHNGVKLIHEEPSFSGELTEGQRAQRAYIRSYLRTIDDLIMKSESIDEETHQALSSLLDLKSAADYWLIQEFSRNTDAYNTSSTYMYKKQNGQLYFGPLWDFDVAWGITEIPYSYSATTTGFNNTKSDWIDHLRAKDPRFMEILIEEWGEMRPLIEELICDGGILDQYKSELAASWQDDYALWSGIESYEIDDYHQAIRNLKS